MGKIAKRAKHNGGGLVHKNVVMANAITQAGQGLNLAEKRIIFAVIAKMSGKIDSSGFVKLTASEYSATYNIPVDLAYTQLKSASEGLFNRYISLREDDAKGVLVSRFRWLDACKYHDGCGFVIISFSKHVIPYLIDLDEKFTKYKLQQACALRSVYSWRLLELLKQQSNCWLHISIDDLHYAFETPASIRNNFGKLRSKIIEPAVRELTAKDGWRIEWEAQKEGRRVASLLFKFEKAAQRETRGA